MPVSFSLGRVSCSLSVAFAQAALGFLQTRGRKLFLEKPRPKAGEEVLLPPSVGQTTRTSAAHQIAQEFQGAYALL